MSTYSEENIARIQELARGTREEYGAMEWGVTPEDLLREAGLEYAEYDLRDRGLIKRLTDSARKMAEKIRAVFIVEEKKVFIDSDLHQARKPFGQAHELAHDRIPEHKEIFYVCSEVDLTPETRRELEFEANVFAAEILFPKPLIESIYENYSLCLESILQLKDVSKASLTSAAIKYVRESPHECCLLILEPTYEKKAEGYDGVKIVRQIFSKAWWKNYKNKEFQNGVKLPPENNLAYSAIQNEIGEIREMQVRSGVTGDIFNAQVTFNGYNSIALIYP